MSVQILIFWAVAPCNLLVGNTSHFNPEDGSRIILLNVAYNQNITRRKNPGDNPKLKTASSILWNLPCSPSAVLTYGRGRTEEGIEHAVFWVVTPRVVFYNYANVKT
jgi:hypothetical protein